MLSADTAELLRVATAAALDKRGFQVVVLDLTELTSFTDSFLICSGAHERQLGAIADEISRQLAAEGRRPLHVEGAGESEWVLLDYGDIVVHLFSEEKRRYYALDALWGDAPRVALEELGVAAGEEPGGRG